MVKAFNLPIDYVLYEMSYVNLTLYSASLPTYKKPNDKKSNNSDELINGDDPSNQAAIDKLFDESNRK